MFAYLLILTLKNDMQLVVRKNNLGGQIVYKGPKF